MSSMFSDLGLHEAILLLPEITMLSGIVALILIPNLGDATMRIPLTRIRVPVLIGGTRFDFTSNPRLPKRKGPTLGSAQRKTVRTPLRPRPCP